MTTPAHATITPAARAVGRIPSGLFILCHSTGTSRSGTLVSWVQQAGFEPLMVSVALRADRSIARRLAVGERFILNQLAHGQGDLMRHFARSSPDREDDFDGLTLSEDPRHTAWGAPVLAGALAAMHVEVTEHVSSGDHVILLARVLDGDVPDAHVEPFVHIRKNGGHY